jgi:Uma2 family endonuclease
MSVDVVRRRFTVDEDLYMVEAGILSERDRVELLDGEIVEMTPVGFSHAAQAAALLRALITRLGSRALVWSRGPIRLSERSLPEPDVTLLHPRPVSYRDAAAEPSDVLLLIHVSDTSLRRDRELELPPVRGRWNPRVLDRGCPGPRDRGPHELVRLRLRVGPEIR